MIGDFDYDFDVIKRMAAAVEAAHRLYYPVGELELNATAEAILAALSPGWCGHVSQRELDEMPSHLFASHQAMGTEIERMGVVVEAAHAWRDRRDPESDFGLIDALEVYDRAAREVARYRQGADVISGWHSENCAKFSFVDYDGRISHWNPCDCGWKDALVVIQTKAAATERKIGEATIARLRERIAELEKRG